MAIIINLDVQMAIRKMSLNELSERTGISVTNLSLFKTGKIKGVRFSTLEVICEVLQCQPGDILEYRPPVSKLSVLNETNEDLLEDAIIETKQAVDTVQIYSDIQSGMMDTFASVISNNINVVMKQLTSFSIILMIPTLIASIYGMNVNNGLETSKLAFLGILIFSIIASTLGVYIFRRKQFF